MHGLELGGGADIDHHEVLVLGNPGAQGLGARAVRWPWKGESLLASRRVTVDTPPSITDTPGGTSKHPRGYIMDGRAADQLGETLGTESRRTHARDQPPQAGPGPTRRCHPDAGRRAGTAKTSSPSSRPCPKPLTEPGSPSSPPGWSSASSRRTQHGQKRPGKALPLPRLNGSRSRQFEGRCAVNLRTVASTPLGGTLEQDPPALASKVSGIRTAINIRAALRSQARERGR